MQNLPVNAQHGKDDIRLRRNHVHDNSRRVQMPAGPPLPHDSQVPAGGDQPGRVRTPENRPEEMHRLRAVRPLLPKDGYEKGLKGRKPRDASSDRARSYSMLEFIAGSPCPGNMVQEVQETSLPPDGIERVRFRHARPES